MPVKTESTSHLCLQPPAIGKYLDFGRASKWSASSISCSTLQLAVTVMRVITFFFYSWGMRAESFNLRFILFWTQRSLSSVWCPPVKQLSTFYVLTGCCESNESHILVSNLNKIQLLGSNPKAMTVNRNPSTSQTLNTLERLHTVSDSLITHSPLSIFSFLVHLKLLYMSDFRQSFLSIHFGLYVQSSTKSDFLFCYVNGMWKSWDLSFHILEKQILLSIDSS